MKRIQVLDTTLRDGTQAPGASMTPAEKLRMAHQLDVLGVDVIEAGFPAGSPDGEAAVQRIAREVRRPVIAALARATAEDVERAARALESAQRSRLIVFMPVSDGLLRDRLGLSRGQAMERVAEAVRQARGFTAEVEFSAQDATRADLGFLCDVAEAAAGAGATVVNVLDTAGYAHPGDFRRIVAALLGRLEGTPEAIVSAHCHDDLGLAVANSLAAIEAGAGQVEGTINGIGPRAGNAALEEIVMALSVRGDAYPFATGVDTREIHRTSQLLSYLTGIHPHPHKSIVGKSVFARQAGLARELFTDEVVTPDRVGVPEPQPVPSSATDRDALTRYYRQMGYELGLDDVERVYRLFTLLTQQKKTLLDEDLLSILHHGTMEDVPPTYKLGALEVSCGKRRAEARVALTESGSPAREAVAEGDGPIAAAFAAIDRLVERQTELEDLSIVAATPGEDAVGEVTVRVRVDGKTFTGRGASPDVVYGAVRAYLHALDKAAHERELGARAMERASYLWGV